MHGPVKHHVTLSSLVTKQEILNAAKLSISKQVFVRINTYGHGSWIMTERVLYFKCKRQRRDFDEEFTL